MLRVSGLKTFVFDEGSGEELLFLHGWGVDHSLYLPMLEYLARNHRVVAPDLPGFGQTEEPTVPYDAGDYARFVLRLCQEMGLKTPALLGHSHGGRTIIKLMSLRQDIISVPRVVLMDASGIRPKRGLTYYAKVYTYKAGKLLTRTVPPLHQRLLARAGSADYRAASPVMRGTLSKLVAEDITPLLPHIKVPALLLWGENDTATPLAHAHIMERLIPDAGLIIFPGGSHYGFLEHWGQCSRVLDSFLGGAQA